MIISASRRTDIPALYPLWFMNRVRAGFCTVPNPFAPSRRTTVSLAPKDVDAVVFWTRNPLPMLPFLEEIETSGLDRYLFLFTLLDYPRPLEPNLPPLDERIETFHRLAERIGPERVIWRYDPIVMTEELTGAYHLDRFEHLAERLAGQTRRCIVSFMEAYAKGSRRMTQTNNGRFIPVEPRPPEAQSLLTGLNEIASKHGISMSTCSQPKHRTTETVRNAPCIDAAAINRLFNGAVPCHKDRKQRERCLCAESRDIGVYDTCTHGCLYCYANGDFSTSRRNAERHAPEAHGLDGHSDKPHLPLLDLI
ncbi:DUF1848 domain-containing protein [Salidesulfovibrio brasiliensis]|uniref:DUF1848 domain-containing protein n=1 Tax=Salidesulfovibrio brasiliensis TaxID=221711 RepID=UPI0006CFCE09|nr:DUF1848 domain-containing protein [Salidesulfovibrio brasiliensis]